MSTFPQPLIWFQLVDSATGEAYKGTSADAVPLPPGSLVVQFRDALKLKCTNMLASGDAAYLVAYRNRAAFDTRNAMVDNEREDSLEEDASVDGLGLSKNNALMVVVPSQEAYEVGTSPTRLSGIAVDKSHLLRTELIQRLQYLVSISGVVLLSSPAGSGKTSLCQLYKAATKSALVVYVPFAKFPEKTPFEILAENGIDFLHGKITSTELANHRGRVVFFLDDAQKKYGYAGFWESLIKSSCDWLDDNKFRFIVSVTHSLDGGIESPVEFQSLKKLGREDFLLSEEEAYEFLGFADVGLPPNTQSHQILKNFLVKQCGGLVGALRMSVDSIESSLFRTKNDPVEERACLQHCLSDSFLSFHARCFGSKHLAPVGDDFKRFLKKCFVKTRVPVVNEFTNERDRASFVSLEKAGILVRDKDNCVSFSSPLAKRYYLKWIYPGRSSERP
jgi:hypothetical protein